MNEENQRYECPYFCPSCGMRLEDLETVNQRTREESYSQVQNRLRSQSKVTVIRDLKYIPILKEHDLMCRNSECSRADLVMDKQILDNMIKIKQIIKILKTTNIKKK